MVLQYIKQGMDKIHYIFSGPPPKFAYGSPEDIAYYGKLPEKCNYEEIWKTAKQDPFGNIPSSAMRRYGLIEYNLNSVTARGAVGHTYATLLIVFLVYQGLKKLSGNLKTSKTKKDAERTQAAIAEETAELRKKVEERKAMIKQLCE